MTTAERIAAAARAAEDELAERLALRADAIADALGRELRLVAWDREQLVGGLQARLQALRERRAAAAVGPEAVRVVERRLQPLESIESAWAQLLAGRRVAVQRERGATTGVAELLREMIELVGHDALVVLDDETDGDAGVAADDPRRWPVVGPAKATARVAWIDPAGDRELAAYVLARTCLRRSGMDPRGVKRAFAIGPLELLQRHAHRLWVGAQVGPADDPGSFAGPADAATRAAFLDAIAAWSAHPGASMWCDGGVLERAGDDGVYLAPALVCVDWPAPELPLAGPMLVVVRCDVEHARAEIEAASRDGAQVVQVGGRPIRFADDVRHIRGALLVDRLPPGLPEPRPV